MPPVEREEVDPHSASELVDNKCFLGSLLCHICSNPRCGADDDSLEALDDRGILMLGEC